MEPDVSPFAPAAAGPEWKDTVGRSAKDGETSSRSRTCRGMPCCFGVPKLRHGTARAGRRLSALASPYLVMQSGLRHRHSADFGRESRPEEYIKERDGKLAGRDYLAIFRVNLETLALPGRERTILALSVKRYHEDKQPFGVCLTKNPSARSSRPCRGNG